MLTTDKVALVKTLIDDSAITVDQIEAYLDLAETRILERLYPFGSDDRELPSRYIKTQCELAVRMIAKRGGEGEISHSENGISRTWSSADDEDILRRVTPCIGVM